MRRPGDRARSGRVLLVGDAAGLVDPLSGDGMYEAFVQRAARCRVRRCAASSTATSPRSSGSSARTFAASWKAKHALDRFPHLVFGVARLPLVWGFVSAFLRGDLEHPGDATGLVRAPLRAGRGTRGLKTRRVAADQPQRGPECGTRPCRRTRRERYPPQGRPAADAPARRRARPAPGARAARRQRPRGRARDRRRHDAGQALALPRDGRARHRLHGRRACRASASTATASAARSRSPSA